MENPVSEALAPRDFMTCARCDHPIPDGAAVCPDCGAPVPDAKVGHDQAHGDIAKANLARMRGDLDGAESQLLSILKRYPNHATAHELLGDLYFERQDYGQAAQWYELALDLSPSTPGLDGKLARAQERIEAETHDQTAAQIGLPPRKPMPWPWIAGGALVAITIFAVVFALTSRNQPDRTVDRGVIEAPPVVSASTATPAPSPVPSASAAVREDQLLLDRLSATPLENGRFVAAMQDARTRTVTVTVAITGGEPRAIAGAAVQSVFTQLPEVPFVTVRIVRDGSAVYMADATRSRYDLTLAPDWRTQNPEPEAFLSAVLANEWPMATAPSPAPTAAPTGPAGDPAAAPSPTANPGPSFSDTGIPPTSGG